MADLFPFVQFEFPRLLGPADGRYIARGEDVERVLILSTLGAPQRRLLGGRRPKDAPAGPEAEAVPTNRVTVITARPLGDPDAARRWLEQTAAEQGARDEAVGDAVALLNRALHAHRAAAADPMVCEVGDAEATAIRIGFGDGDAVVQGLWVEARILPRRPPRRGRLAEIPSQQRVAAVLGGRERVMACETLLLRARLDLDGDRPREAALQLRVGLEALLSEAKGGGADEQADLGFLASRREATGQAANAALEGELDAGAVEGVRETLEACEKVLRRRRVLHG